MRGGGEINLPVDGSPPLGLESTFAPTLSLSLALSALFHPNRYEGRARRLSPLRSKRASRKFTATRYKFDSRWTRALEQGSGGTRRGRGGSWIRAER